MRSAALLGLVLLPFVAGSFLADDAAPVPPLECSQVVSLVQGEGERLVCDDDPRVASCADLLPGERVRDCESIGPIRGPVLAMRAQPVDVNRASAEDLRALTDVGEGLARRIVEGREGRPYCSAADLQRVSGIGARRAKQFAHALAFRHELCATGAAQ